MAQRHALDWPKEINETRIRLGTLGMRVLLFLQHPQDVEGGSTRQRRHGLHAGRRAQRNKELKRFYNRVLHRYVRKHEHNLFR